MTLLAIIARELRSAARRAGTFRARFLTVLVTIGVFAFVFWTAIDGSLPVEQQGRIVFHRLALAISICSLLLGLMLTPDSVSAEKRENTLGLLFLTDLKGFHVVLGKLVANSWNGLYCLLGILPVLAIPMLMGGVTGSDLLQVATVLIAFLLLSVSAGIFVSTFSLQEWRAIFYTALFLLAITGLPVFIAYWLAPLRGPTNELWPLFLLSPVYAWITWEARFQSLGPGPASKWPEEYVWIMAGALVVLAALLILIASRYIARSWTDTRSPTSRIGHSLWLKGPWRRHSQSNRRRLLSENPHLWLALRDPTKKGLVWFFVISMAAIWFWAYLTQGRFALSATVLQPTLGIIHWTLIIWLIVEASGRFLESRQNGTFELILTTPSGPREIISGQARGLKQMFLGPILLVVLLHFVLYIGVLAPRGLINLGSWDIPLTVAGTNLIWMVTLWTVAWVGLAASLTAKGLTRAIFKTFFIGFLLPVIVTAIATPLIEMAFLTRASANAQGPFPYWKPSIRIGLSLAIVFLYAWPILYGRFRMLIAPGEDQPKWA